MMCLMPAIFTLGPLGCALYWVVVHTYELNRSCNGRMRCNLCTVMGCLFWTLFGICILLPLYIALAGLAAALLIAFGTVPGIYYGFAYIIRVIYAVASQ
jgi:hypothetical protein